MEEMTIESESEDRRSQPKSDRDKGCTHQDQVRDVEPVSQGCQKCIEMGDNWVHLRLCLTCGHVGCCDSSKNKHARKHANAESHPIVESFEPGESWRWCYADEMYVG